MIYDDDVCVGSFMFCREHGCEFCNECCTDHRFSNNIQIIDKLSAAFPGLTEYHFMDRPPISYVLEKVAVETKSSRPGDRVYECREHHKSDCSTCFDWAKVALNNIKRQAKSSNSKVIPVDITRDEKLKFLHSMGVELSPNTRLPDDAIERKFRGAIDAAQSFEKLIDKPPFDPSSLPTWSKETSGETLQKSVSRNNIVEALANFRARSEGKQNAWDMYENTFIDLRQTVLALANGVDIGAYKAIVQDKDKGYAICIRIIEVRTIGKDPVMMLLYCRGTRDTPASTTFRWVQDTLAQSKAKRMPVLNITASPEEQKLLLAILNLNARRLSSNYSPQRRQTEASFVLSFLLPIAPIGQQDLGRLTNHTGCVVCGKKTTSKCSQCLSVEYCGTDCQRSHWKEHKPMCNSLKGGEWVDINFSMMSTEMRLSAAMGQKLYFSHVSFMSSNIMEDGNKNTYDTDNPPPIPSNIHGDSPFLIKMQKGSSVLIYDRQRSVQAYLCSDVDPKGYEKTMAQMHTGPRGLKVYRWAKRTGETRLSVCLNKAPAKDPLW